jgi:hypothetical protein
MAWGLAIEAAAAIIGLLAWAGIAHATPQADAQALTDDTAVWIGGQLHIPPPTRTVETVTRMEMSPGAIAQAPFERPVLQTTATIVASLGAIHRNPAGAAALTGDGRIVIHELLHRARQPVRFTDNDRRVEEGVVEAVTADLYPAWSSRFTGWGAQAILPAPAYAPAVRDVRAASRAATGSASWRDRAARLWRRQLLLQDEAGRDTMLTAAAAAR